MNSKYNNSQNLLQRAKKVIPVAAQTYSKSYRYFCEGNSPAFLDRGKGSYVWDVDDNKFIDFICALGPVTIGYNDERVNNAIIEQLNKGISFSQPSDLSIKLAEKLTDILPAAEMVKFVKNGSDATSAAVKLARAYTGKDMVAVCGYHGMDNWYIGSTENNKGVPKAVCDLTKKFEYNNLDSVEKLFEENSDQIGAVILEPIQENGPKEDYLNKLKKIVHSNGAVLIFDEVVSGFRYALGGASELYDVTPDLVAVGKGMANGMSLSAVAGKKEIIELIESQNVFVSTTFGGENLSIASAIKTIEIMEEENYFDHVWDLGKIKLEHLDALIAEYDLKEVISTVGLPPHCGLKFDGYNDLDYLDIKSVFLETMINEGILTIGINNISLSHTKKDIKNYLNSAEIAMIAIKKAIENNSISGILKGEKINPVFKRN